MTLAGETVLLQHTSSKLTLHGSHTTAAKQLPCAVVHSRRSFYDIADCAAGYGSWFSEGTMVAYRQCEYPQDPVCYCTCCLMPLVL